MPSLERVMHLAYDHGYRVGLQLGEHGRCVLHVRDVSHDAKVIAIISATVEDAADRLMIEMLRRKYVPRQDRGAVA